MGSDTFRTIRGPSKGLFRDKGSRFLADAFPVTSPEQVKSIVDRIKKEYHDARHHCYAYMIGKDRLTWRSNDDGEPSGTAGKPILGQINSQGLTNILIVVTRYFGGTLLGVSGLTNAYRAAASDAICNAEIIESMVHVSCELRYQYAAMNDVMKILKEEGAGHTPPAFDSECSLTFEIRESSIEKLLGRLSRVPGVTYRRLETK